MRIADSILKERLSHVYWITGAACAGKTTVTNLLAQKYNILIFPDRHSEYQERADFSDFPSMRIPWPGTDWEWFFGRSAAESARWLDESSAADLEFKIVDLLSELRDRKIVVDDIFDPLTLIKISSPERIISLISQPEMIRRELLHRPDHSMILECIRNNTKNPEAMEDNVVQTAVMSAEHQKERAKAAGVRIVYREKDATPETLLGIVEEHFGFTKEE